MGARVFRICLFGAGGLLCAALLSGCRSDYSPSFEAFSRNKLAVIGRNMETTRDAQTKASEKVTEAVATIQRDTWTGADPIEAYNVARRAEAGCDTRVREAHRRLTTLEASANDFFRKWAVENTEYEDPKLKESSRQNLSKVKTQFDQALAAMKKADGVTQPALDALQDQVLFLKHHRNFPTVPERPLNSSNPAGPAQILAKLTEEAAAKATEFAASVKPK
jgi:Protein of unknown function (DUF2959)